MAVIRKTIGVGGDYADIGTANAAIYAYYPFVWPAPHMTDDWILTIVSDFTENTGTNANYVFYDGHYIKITNPNKYICTVAPSGGGTVKMLRFHSRTTFPASAINDKMYFYDLIFNLPFINPANAFSFLYFCPGNQNTYTTAIYKNCVFLCNGYAATNHARRSSLIGLEGGVSLQWSNASILNCKFYNYGTAIGSSRIGTNQIVTIENCTSYLCHYGLAHTSAIPVVVQYNVRNFASVGSAGVDYFSLLSTLENVNFINCADSDGSLLITGGNLIGCKHNAVPVNEFESLVAASDNFLKPIKIDATVHIEGSPRTGPVILKTKFSNEIRYSSEGILAKSGIPPTLTDRDLAGNLYGEFGLYPIGCYNAEANPIGEVWET